MDLIIARDGTLYLLTYEYGDWSLYQITQTEKFYTSVISFVRGR
jgi:hypothetical protein